MNWHPLCTPDTVIARARMLSRTRDFFRNRSVLEVETPLLSARATLDPNIASLPVSTHKCNAYLITSPEYHMKRLLAAGHRDIFQICRVFRNEESGRHHLPEFTLLEWYRNDFSLQDIILETVACIQNVIDPPQLTTEVEHLSYREAFMRTLGIDPLVADCATIRESLNADDDLAVSLGQDRVAWLDLAMAERVANSFDATKLTVVSHYPLEQAALARQCPDDPALADRFEVFAGSLELANGFVELRDAETQRERFVAEQRQRRESNLPVHQVDEQLLGALEAGLPNCAGVAVGLDRVLMIAENIQHIQDAVTFTLENDL